VSPLPLSVNALKQRVTTVTCVDEDMLWCVWNELDYRIDTEKPCKYFGYINNTAVFIKR
jgi:hypothetical protein